MSQPAFPFIDVSGPADERGRQYGRAAAERIRRSVALYGGRLSTLGLDGDGLRAVVDGILPRIAAYGPDYVDEMRGIAEGAGQPLEQIVLINARTEILALARRASAAAQTVEPDGCTGAVILPERSRNGRLIHGQNWDWMAECAETAVVLRVRRDDGPDFLTFTEAGGLARSGLNAAGIAITANYLECDRDHAQAGVPLALIRRKVLEQAHLAPAMQAVAATPKAASNNMIVSHRDGFAIDFECAPDEAFTIYPTDGLIVHANHWQSQVALTKLREGVAGAWADSFYRDWRVRKLLDARGPRLDREDMKAAFFDDFGSPYAVCRAPHLSPRGHVSATVAMIVMEPAAGIMEVAPLPAGNRAFTRYSLADAPVTPAA